MTLTRYIIGFVLSIALTLLAVGLVQFAAPAPFLAVALVVLALIQFIVQLIFFLHLGTEKRPGATVTVFTFALIVVCILVGGTLWIMNNLSSHQAMPGAWEHGIVSPQTEP